MLVVKVAEKGDVLIAGTPHTLERLAAQIACVAQYPFGIGFEQIRTMSPDYCDPDQKGIEVTVVAEHAAQTLKVIARDGGP